LEKKKKEEKKKNEQKKKEEEKRKRTKKEEEKRKRKKERKKKDKGSNGLVLTSRFGVSGAEIEENVGGEKTRVQVTRWTWTCKVEEVTREENEERSDF